MCNFFNMSLDNIDACDMCDQFKRVNAVRVNDIVYYCCWDCESNLYYYEEEKGIEG